MMARSPKTESTGAEAGRQLKECSSVPPAVFPAASVAVSQTSAALRDRLAESSAAARAFLEAIRSVPVPDDWKGARKDAADLATVVAAIAGMAKHITMDLQMATDHTPEIRAAWQEHKSRDTSLSMLVDTMKAVRSKLRPDRAKGQRSEHPPIGCDDLMRDLARCSPIAIIRREWRAGDPEYNDNIDEELKKIASEARPLWLARQGWNRGEMGILIARVRELLLQHGHLLDREAPTDLCRRLETEITKIRERRHESERAPENFVRAVLRAYGLTTEEAKKTARSAQVK